MRVWIDITGPAHVLVFRPLVRVLRERGDLDARARGDPLGVAGEEPDLVALLEEAVQERTADEPCSTADGDVHAPPLC